MIITRTPLRVSLGGGGTDLPSYYRENGGGFLVAAAISKYVYIAVNRNFDDDLLLKYSQVERVAEPSAIAHPILRECLLVTGITGGIEISSMADIPAGTGLGSSGAFTVGVLRALLAHKRETPTNRQLAELACHIELERLCEPIGKQDQYASAIGGVTAFEFHPDDTVTIRAVPIPEGARHRLEEDLLLFYTGMRRSASEEITAQVDAQPGSTGSIADNLNEVRAIGSESFEALAHGDLGAFAELMTRQWKLKLARSPSALHDQIDGYIARGLSAGASGGKLVGAGGGGFLLFLAEAKSELRRAMAQLGLEEVRFAFDDEGAKTIIS